MEQEYEELYYIDNSYLDYEETKDDMNKLKEQIYQILINDIKIFYDKIKYPINTQAIASVNKETHDSYEMYHGAGGYLFAFLNLHDFFKKQQESDFLINMKDHIKNMDDQQYFKMIDPTKYLQDAEYSYKALINLVRQKEQQKKNVNFTFLFSPTGVYTLGCQVYYHLGDHQNFQECINQILQYKQYILLNKDNPKMAHEILYGVSGYLYCLLDLQRRFQIETSVKNDFKINLQKDVFEILELIFQVGLKNYKKPVDFNAKLPNDFRLVYYIWNKEYLGAAHGLSGILNIMMKAYQYNKDYIQQTDPNFVDQFSKAIVKSLDHIVSWQFPSGNYPAVGKKNEIDDLNQYCHGAPGIIQTLILGNQLFSNKFKETDAFLFSALKAGDSIWQYGLLKKGFNLCHGIMGNAYPFLTLYNATKDQKWYYRALKFACSKNDQKVLEAIQNFNFSDRFKQGVSDFPYSLMIGMAGEICFECDCIMPENARFPTFEA